MKKSQVMAAIALAMALGVVAPIAGVVGNTSALTIEVKEGAIVKIHGKATCAEAKSAVAYIKANTDYKDLIAFKEATKYGAETEGLSFVTGTNVAVMWINQAEANAMVSAIKTKAATAVDRAADAATPVFAAGSDEKTIWKDADSSTTAPYGSVNTTPAIVANIISAVKSVDNYKIYRAIYDAVNADTADVAAYKSAVDAFNDKYTADLSGNADELNGLRSTPATIPANLVDYADFEALFKVVDRAETELNAYNTAFKKVNDAYGVLNAAEQVTYAGQQAYKTAVTDAKWPTIAAANKSLMGVVLNSDNFAYSTDLKVVDANIIHGADWNDVTTKINAINTCDKSTDQNTVYKKLEDLAKAYAKATDDTSAIGDVIKAIVAGSNTGSNNNNDGAGDKEDEDKDTPSADAPAAGILGSANGTATTVSIVAGLATALSALGAGVVAYRSARRSK